MNVVVENTIEKVQDTATRNYGDVFIRGNNGEYILRCHTDFSPVYISSLNQVQGRFQLGCAYVWMNNRYVLIGHCW